MFFSVAAALLLFLVCFFWFGCFRVGNVQFFVSMLFFEFLMFRENIMFGHISKKYLVKNDQNFKTLNVHFRKRKKVVPACSMLAPQINNRLRSPLNFFSQIVNVF